MSSPILNTIPLQEITFDGNESENVSLFLQNVKRVAFAQGRQRDDEWLADYVETCLIDDALEWYDTLDKDIQRDFSSLRTAMLERFRRSTRIANMPLAPAAAAPRLISPPIPNPPPQQ
ncbi:hypothetical protein FRB96_007317 [Tulasnella sp. 330]|nr:hypothetical protein FRB96_007317 [Tulasnella sp. 330]